MKKWLTRCAVTASLILIALLALQHSPQTTGMWLDMALPTGKVRPQLAVIEGVGEAWLLAPDGSLWGWGESSPASRFALTAIPRRFGSDTHWLKLATSRVQAVGLKDDGSLWGWGLTQQLTTSSDCSTPTRIGTATNWVQAATGVRECLALKIDGSLWGWGYNDMGAIGDGTTNLLRNPAMIGSDHDWQVVAASQETGFAVKTNGTLWAWGYIDGKIETIPRRLDSGTNWVMIAAGEHEMMALKSDGTIWRKAISSRRPEAMTQIGRDDDWKAIDVRLLSYFAVKADGSRWWWGLSNGTNVASPERLPSGYAACSDEPPVRPHGGRPGTSIVLTEDGGLWTEGARICSAQGVVRWKIGKLLAPIARYWAPLGNMLNGKVDNTPYRLWELPPEVRQSLGIKTKGATSDGPTTQSPKRPE